VLTSVKKVLVGSRRASPGSGAPRRRRSTWSTRCGR